MRFTPLALCLLLSAQVFAQTKIDLAPARLTNVTCYKNNINNRPRETQLTKIFELDKDAKVRVNGVAGKIIVNSQAVSAKVFRNYGRTDAPDVHLQKLNGKDLVQGYLYPYYTYDYVKGAYDVYQSKAGVWFAGAWYNEGWDGDVLCGPTEYGPAQRFPDLKEAMKFLVSNAVPIELATFVSKNLGDVKQTLGYHSDLSTRSEDAGEAIADEIVLPGTRSTDNEYCEISYTLRFNIFSKKFSAVRGHKCPDDNF